MGLFDKFKSKHDYASELHHAIKNDKPVSDIMLAWLENGSHEDANYLYCLVATGVNGGTMDKDKAIYIFKDAENLPAENKDLREFYRNWAMNALAFKLGVFVDQ